MADPRLTLFVPDPSPISPPFQRALDMLSEPDSWVLYKSTKDFQSYTSNKPGYRMKSQGIINESVVNLGITGIEREGAAANEQMDEMAYLEGSSLTKEAFVWVSFKGMGPASKRDFVLRRLVRTLEDGSFLSVTESVERPDCPPRPGYVRAVVHISVALFRPLPESTPEHPHTEVTLAVWMDLKGSIPFFLVNLGRGQHGKTIIKIGDHAREMRSMGWDPANPAGPSLASLLDRKNQLVAS
ncbi:hypothetical protein PAPYR_4934 [Paratrimastix pyriformis]|uniref:START domain-containing protein n=1 Tax=Paratrimastix pyriformis TaxID=342808 RepID=A0ABQ8UIT5_9EUKA|nr:hypothetical protein PAPYR_4934 [Paratrimastix pyriformis]